MICILELEGNQDFVGNVWANLPRVKSPTLDHIWNVQKIAIILLLYIHIIDDLSSGWAGIFFSLPPPLPPPPITQWHALPVSSIMSNNFTSDGSSLLQIPIQTHGRYRILARASYPAGWEASLSDWASGWRKSDAVEVWRRSRQGQQSCGFSCRPYTYMVNYHRHCWWDRFTENTPRLQPKLVLTRHSVLLCFD